MNTKPTKPQERFKALVPDGVPRYVRVYDQGEGHTGAARYTIVFTGQKGQGHFLELGPGHVHFGQTGNKWPIDSSLGGPNQGGTKVGGAPKMGQKHPDLGKRIPFNDMSREGHFRRIAYEKYLEIWGLSEAMAQEPLSEAPGGINYKLGDEEAAREQYRNTRRPDELARYQAPVRNALGIYGPNKGNEAQRAQRPEHIIHDSYGGESPQSGLHTSGLDDTYLAPGRPDFDKQSQFLNVLNRREETGGQLRPTVDFFENYADVEAGEVVRFPADEETYRNILRRILNTLAPGGDRDTCVRMALDIVRPLLQPGMVVDWRTMREESGASEGVLPAGMGEALTTVFTRLEDEAQGNFVFGPSEVNPYPLVHVCRELKPFQDNPYLPEERKAQIIQTIGEESGERVELAPQYVYICGAEEGPWISVARFLHYTETGEGLPPFTRLCLDCADKVSRVASAPTVGSVGVYVGPAGTGLRQRATLALLAMAFPRETNSNQWPLHADYWTREGQHVVILACDHLAPEGEKPTVWYVIGHLTTGHEVEVIFSGKDFQPAQRTWDNPLGRLAAAELLFFFDHQPEGHVELTARQFRFHTGRSQPTDPIDSPIEQDIIGELKSALLLTDNNGEPVPDDLVAIPQPGHTKDGVIWPPYPTVRKAILEAPWYEMDEVLLVSAALLPNNLNTGPLPTLSDMGFGDEDRITYIGAKVYKVYSEEEGFSYFSYRPDF